MNERYIQAMIVGVLVGGAILLAEMIDAGNERGPANAKPSSFSLVLRESAEQREAGNPLAVQLAQIESMDDPSQTEMLRKRSSESSAMALLTELKRIEALDDADQLAAMRELVHSEEAATGLAELMALTALESLENVRLSIQLDADDTSDEISINLQLDVDAEGGAASDSVEQAS